LLRALRPVEALFLVALRDVPKELAKMHPATMIPKRPIQTNLV
jgi:hypothetical protein